jgi:hypothetical protein
MGTKFGNIHVRTNQIDEVLAALKEMISASKAAEVMYIRTFESGWVSILNDSFGWGCSEACGETLSRYLSSPVLTCSYFDDDVLEINLFQGGEYLTGHLWCTESTQEDYELENKEANISILAELLGHAHTEQIIQTLNQEDLEAAIGQLESILQIPLWIHSEWFEDIEDEEILIKYVKYDF